MSHTADKIAVRRGYTLLACRHYSHVATHTRSAARRIHRASRVYKDIQKTFFYTLFVDLLRRRNDHHAYVLMDRPAFQYRRRLPHIFHTSVGA